MGQSSTEGRRIGGVDHRAQTVVVPEGCGCLLGGKYPGGTGFEGLVDEAGAVFEGAGASDEQRAPPHQSRVLHHVGGTPAAVAHETGHTGEAGAQRIDRGVGS